MEICKYNRALECDWSVLRQYFDTDYSDGSSARENAGQLLYDEIRYPDCRNWLPAIYLSNFAHVPGKTDGPAKR